jgi:hypothetical protein
MLGHGMAAGLPSANNLGLPVDKPFEEIDVLIVDINRPWTYSPDE